MTEQISQKPMTDRMAAFHKGNQHFLSRAPNDSTLADDDANTWRCEKHLYFPEDGSGYYALVFEIADTGHRHYLVSSLTIQHWSPTEGLTDSELLTFGSTRSMNQQLQDAVKERQIPKSLAVKGVPLIDYIAKAMKRMVGEIEFARPIARKTQQGDCV